MHIWQLDTAFFKNETTRHLFEKHGLVCGFCFHILLAFTPAPHTSQSDEGRTESQGVFPTSFGGACGGIDLLRAVPTDTPGCEMQRRFSLSENMISIHGAAISFLFMDLLSSRTGMEFV